MLIFVYIKNSFELKRLNIYFALSNVILFHGNRFGEISRLMRIRPAINRNSELMFIPCYLRFTLYHYPAVLSMNNPLRYVHFALHLKKIDFSKNKNRIPFTDIRFIILILQRNALKLENLKLKLENLNILCYNMFNSILIIPLSKKRKHYLIANTKTLDGR